MRAYLRKSYMGYRFGFAIGLRPDPSPDRFVSDRHVAPALLRVDGVVGSLTGLSWASRSGKQHRVIPVTQFRRGRLPEIVPNPTALC